MKKFLLWLLLLIISFPVIARDFEYTYQGQTLRYSVLDEAAKTCSVKQSSKEPSGALVIPSTVSDGTNKYSVTSIGNDAFVFCDELTSVTIPNSVTSIGNKAFYYCEKLKSLYNTELPNLTSIGNSAFRSCINLNGSLSFPSLTEIGQDAFYNCQTISSISLSSNLKKIPANAFRDCYSLQSINISSELVSIGEYAFYNCKLLNCSLSFYALTELGQYAFAYCECIPSVSINSNIEVIPPHAFDRCTSITSVVLPTNLIEIGDYAFDSCAFSSIVLPSSLKKICYCGFLYCMKLESIVIPPNCTDIGSTAFQHCFSLKDITLPQELTVLPDYMFNGCSNLKSITLPNSLESIGRKAFGNAVRLESISIPKSVKSIASEVFYNCPNLANINIFADSFLTIEESVFGVQPLQFGNWDGVPPKDIRPTAKLTVPSKWYSQYKADPVWGKFKNIEEMAPEATFAMAGATMRMGEILTLPISLSNAVDITSFQCDIRLPGGFEAVKNAKGKLVIRLGDRKSDTHTINANVMDDGVVRVACLSIDNSTFSGKEGELFSIDIQPVSAEAGVHEITIDNIVAAQPDGKGVNIEPAKCAVTLRKALIPGDVNDDDVVNVSDAIATVSYILGNKPEPYLQENADLNGDGTINILDATEIIKIVLGTNQASQVPAVVKTAALNVVNNSETEALYVENFEIKGGEEKLLSVKLRADREYTGFQTDIYLPDGLEVVTTTKGNTTTPVVKLNEECNSGSHIISSAMQKDGALRVLSMSMANEMYLESADKTLFTVKVRVKPDFKAATTSPIYFRGTLFDTGKIKSYFADSSSEIGINNPSTGIADIIENGNAKKYFNLQGIPVQNPVKGMIYILKTATSAEKVVY